MSVKGLVAVENGHHIYIVSAQLGNNAAYMHATCMYIYYVYNIVHDGRWGFVHITQRRGFPVLTAICHST